MVKKTVSVIGSSLISVLAVAVLVNPFASATVPGNNYRLSLTGAGGQSSVDTQGTKMSRDGKFVVFMNSQNGFVGTDTNNASDIFLRNISSGTTTRVSVSASGVSSDKGGQTPVISETGRYIAFGSMSLNLIDGQTTTTNNKTQLYIRDVQAGTVTLITDVSANTGANNSSTALDISSDGRYVLFVSTATDLGPTVPSGVANLYLYDKSTDSIEWVNGATHGVTGDYSYGAHMNCDGSFIVFNGNAASYGLSATSKVEVLMLDRRGGNKLTNVTASANGAALLPTISCNGNYIGFASYANNLDPLTAGLSIDYYSFIYDRIANDFDLLDQSTGGTRANAYVMNSPTQPFFLSLSDKGSAVFRSTATNLVSGVTGSQLYVRDTKAGTTELLTRDSGGTQSDDASDELTMSLDGKLVSYTSYATNLVSGDTNAKRDVYLSETGY